ncbi:uncharacterized protein V1510DRAFT_430277 [Dipodascopsis tothii]|uniref:uncharacterized protein n=1 Tax=Dipodascopsis tothii TaxID=44089 RepID=UPI0034CD672B
MAAPPAPAGPRTRIDATPQRALRKRPLAHDSGRDGPRTARGRLADPATPEKENQSASPTRLQTPNDPKSALRVRAQRDPDLAVANSARKLQEVSNLPHLHTASPTRPSLGKPQRLLRTPAATGVRTSPRLARLRDLAAAEPAPASPSPQKRTPAAKPAAKPATPASPATPRSPCSPGKLVLRPSHEPPDELFVNRPAPLAGVRAYVDVWTAEGDDASSTFSLLLEALGARVHKTLGASTTHIVYKDGSPSSLRAACTRQLHCVGIGWVVECDRQQRRVDEAPYKIDAPATPLYAQQRKRKSLEPHALYASPATPASRDRFPVE